MSDSTKLIYLDQDNIKKMIVFFGDKGVDINELFVKDNQNYEYIDIKMRKKNEFKFASDFNEQIKPIMEENKTEIITIKKLNVIG
jgi:hypothetical protein